MKPEELAIRLSLEKLNEAIMQLCIQRDQLAAILPNAPRPKKMTHCMGMEIKQGGKGSRK